MNAKLRRRLDLLEKNTQLNRASMQEEIMAAALSAMTLEDLEQLHQFGERGVPLSECTPEERAALDHYEIEHEAATRRITARPISKLGPVSVQHGNPNSYR
jgi:hypothetical protein